MRGIRNRAAPYSNPSTGGPSPAKNSHGTQKGVPKRRCQQGILGSRKKVTWYPFKNLGPPVVPFDLHFFWGRVPPEVRSTASPMPWLGGRGARRCEMIRFAWVHGSLCRRREPEGSFKPHEKNGQDPIWMQLLIGTPFVLMVA